MRVVRKISIWLGSEMSVELKFHYPFLVYYSKQMCFGYFTVAFMKDKQDMMKVSMK